MAGLLRPKEELRIVEQQGNKAFCLHLKDQPYIPLSLWRRISTSRDTDAQKSTSACIPPS